MEFQILSNGIEIPALGLGTWFIDDDKADKAVISAVKIGYRHMIPHKPMATKEALEQESKPAVFREKNFLSQAKWRQRPKHMTQRQNPLMKRSIKWDYHISILC